jgi:hypothetical protein
MHSYKQKKFHVFQANATALGGQLLEPLRKIILPQAPVSLPPVGGFAAVRSGAFNLDEIIRFSSAYTLVTGREMPSEGGAGRDVPDEGSSHATLATAVVEDFNLLEIVTADRIVAQIAVTTPSDGGPQRISFGGSRFEGLRVAGNELRPKVNADLFSPTPAAGEGGWPSTWEGFRQTVSSQAETLVGLFGYHPDKDAVEWARGLHGWNTVDTAPGRHGTYSLFDGFEGPAIPGAYGHILDIPDFGRIYLGEVFISPYSIQLVSIRADLGCPISGQVSGPTADAAGGTGKGNKH